MNEEKGYRWIKLYRDISFKLLDYKNDRRTLISKLEKALEKANMQFPKLEEDNSRIDIDPFTVIGTFNKQMKHSNRMKIVESFCDEFGIDMILDKENEDNFLGIPVLMPLMPRFFGWQRGANDIDNLWNLFDVAIKYADSDGGQYKTEFEASFDKVIKQSLVKWNITMGLFWIRPNFYVSLDGNNQTLFSKEDILGKDFFDKICEFSRVNKKGATVYNLPTGKQYADLCELAREALTTGDYDYKTIAELSHYSWNLEKDNKEVISSAAFLTWFNPVLNALRDLGGEGTPAEVRERIIQNENLTEEFLAETRGKTNINKFSNEVAFARNYLVYAGYISNEVRGIWKLTTSGWTAEITQEMASDIFKRGMERNIELRKEKASLDVRNIHYWLYSPGENAYLWDEFYSKGIMAIGWSEIGDLQEFSSKDEMKSAMKETYDENLTYRNTAHATWQFANEMHIGDIGLIISLCEMTNRFKAA